MNTENSSARAGALVKVMVLAEDKKPLQKQALVRLVRMETGQVQFQSTRDSEAQFPNMPAGKYLIEIGAAGYLAVHEQFTLPDLNQDFTETTILHKDPAAVDLSISDIKTLPAKVRKNTEKGVQALQLGNLQEAQKYLDPAVKQAPDSSRLQFLAGYLALQQKDTERAIAYLTTATKLDVHNSQAQGVLGKLYYEKGDCTNAIVAEDFVAASSSDSIASRKILANCALKIRDFEKARASSQWLVDRGGPEANEGRLILGQALAGLHRDAEAIAQLNAFLEAMPKSDVAPDIRDLVAVLQKRANGDTSAGDIHQIFEGSKVATDESLGSSAGMPEDIDAHPPAIVSSVQCPANLLDETSDRSKELVDDVAKFSAIEDMVHERLGDNGLPRNRESRKYNYLVSITEPPTGALIVQEFRDSAGGTLDMPEQIVTSGLPVLAIAFHPAFRKDFDMKCEGLGAFNGQATWLVHFQQREDKPAQIRTYKVNGNNYPIHLKGRAWIAADSFQIVHLETDLVRPVPEIRLLTEHTTVSYGPVEFKKFNTDLWLPKSADLYVHFSKHRFHRSESFDHFMLWATDATDKIKAPPSSPPPSPAADRTGGPNQH